MDKKPVLFSGMAPSGTLTIGNYAGALKNWKNLQSSYDCYFTIVDLHAITIRQEPKDLRARTLSFLAQYIAAGIDPEKSILFIQSHVSEHSELAWILGCFTSFGELSRMTQFKDKSQKHEKNINAGLFTYPVLMASDILLYGTNLVPVGSDQKQHLELARNIAIKFNNTYSETFTIPEPYIPKTGAKIMSLQEPENKMDKSSSNQNSFIAIIDEPDIIVNKIKRAVTDSQGIIEYDENRPGITNLISMYSVLSEKEPVEIVDLYKGKGYSEFKKDLGELTVQTLSPIRKKYLELIKNKDYLESIAKEGAEKACLTAFKTLRKVHKKIGFIPKK